MYFKAKIMLAIISIAKQMFVINGNFSKREAAKEVIPLYPAVSKTYTKKIAAATAIELIG